MKLAKEILSVVVSVIGLTINLVSVEKTLKEIKK